MTASPIVRALYRNIAEGKVLKTSDAIMTYALSGDLDSLPYKESLTSSTGI